MSIESALVEASGKIGRSFSLASFLPSGLFVAWIASVGALIVTPEGGPSAPSLRGLVTFWTDWTSGKALAFGTAIFAVALLLHPLLFATTQLLEGYWGAGRVATMLTAVRAGAHRRRIHTLESRVEASRKRVQRLVERAYRERFLVEEDSPTLAEFHAGWLSSPEGIEAFAHELQRDANLKARGTYPMEANRAMPTRLGNALRREEDRIGRQYGLEVLRISGHLAWISPPQHMQRVDDARHQLDAAVRHCSIGLMAFLLTTVALLPAGWWLLFSLVPYAYAYVSYRGAIAAADEYTFQIAVLVDLDRFPLYDALRLPPPEDTDQERETNGTLMHLLSGAAVSLPFLRVGAESSGRQRLRGARSVSRRRRSFRSM